MVDEIDKKIIRELQQNGRPVLSLLAKKLGISLSTLSRRIKRLIAENTIRMIAVGPDPSKAGHGNVAVIGLSTEMNRIDEVCSEVCKLEEITWA